LIATSSSFTSLEPTFNKHSQVQLINQTIAIRYLPKDYPGLIINKKLLMMRAMGLISYFSLLESKWDNREQRQFCPA
jgi:hypothetical protein